MKSGQDNSRQDNNIKVNRDECVHINRMKESLSEYIPRKIMQEIIINPRYRSIDKIGSGSFGEIHKVYDMVDKKLRAVKIEKKDKRGAQGMLLKEAFIMKQMKDCYHFPRLIEEMSNDQMSFIIMSYLGANLETLKKKYNRLSIYTTLLIGSQMVEALQLMHGKGFLHRDIKPENFVIGTEGNHHNIYIIDFGLSKKYIDNLNKHIPMDQDKGLVGTARYTSINSHNGIEQSRRDDLEALGYVLIYLTQGELPWQNLTPQNREEKFEQIKRLKIETKIEDLTAGLPDSFRTYMKHVKSLAFEQEPQYKLLQNSFLQDAMKIQALNQIPLASSYCLDWCDKSCSIQKQYADKIFRQLPPSAALQVEQLPQQNNELQDVKRRDTQFTQTPQFYQDTVEKPNELPVFEVPMFRTEQSLAISRHTFAPTDENGKLSKSLFNGTDQTVDRMLFKIGAHSDNQKFLDEHSQNSSQYNNISSEYNSLQDEQVLVQKVVTSSPIRFSMTENQIHMKNSYNHSKHAETIFHKGQSSSQQDHI